MTKQAVSQWFQAGRIPRIAWISAIAAAELFKNGKEWRAKS